MLMSSRLEEAKNLTRIFSCLGCNYACTDEQVILRMMLSKRLGSMDSTGVDVNIGVDFIAQNLYGFRS